MMKNAPPDNYIIAQKQTTIFSNIREKGVSNTSEFKEFTHVELKALRESLDVPRWKLAKEIGMSESTLERLEKGEKKPTPEDVDSIEEKLGVQGIWHKWMLSNHDSYRKRYTDVPHNDSLAETLMRTKYEAIDVVNVLTEVERDALSGKFKSPEQRKRLRRETQELMAALQQTLDRISDDDGD